MEVDNITSPSEGPLEAGATRVGRMCLSVTMLAGGNGFQRVAINRLKRT